jgi:uncharacterized protein (DUF305 family)
MRAILTATTVLILVAACNGFSSMLAAAQPPATPPASPDCEAITGSPISGTPGAMMGSMATEDMPMAEGTPMAGMDHMAMELDQMDIDMMIPHHASIIAMAEAALPRLTDARLREMAQAIVATQQPEIEELRGLRQMFYGGAEPMPMDEAMMTAMGQMMPGMSGTMAEMAFQMNAPAQVEAICAAVNADLAFIDLTIPHHRMAIESSEIVLEQSERDEIREFARRVIAAQQAEIDALTEIREELIGSATPAN